MQKAFPLSGCFLPTSQTLQAVSPEPSLNFPAAQAEHESKFDVVECLPGEHVLHELAPGKEPVFVIEPAPHKMQRSSAFDPSVPTYLPTPQSVHAPTFDFVEYFPAEHLVHVVAPVLVPLFVIEPAPHAIQPVVELVEYRPAKHGVHASAPGVVPVLVIEPGEHSWHWDAPLAF